MKRVLVNVLKKLGLINILSPTYQVIKRIIIKKQIPYKTKHYDKLIREIKRSGRTKLRFGVYALYDSSYGGDQVFQLMLKNRDYWDVKVVIVPDVLRGKEHMEKTYAHTKLFFENKYGKEYVLDGYETEIGRYIDRSDEFDIIYFANPYDLMVHRIHSIQYVSKKKVLPIYISYGFDVGKATTLSRLKSYELNLLWKCFTDTDFSFQEYKENQIIEGKNVVLTGYTKMDGLAKYEYVKKERKKILLSPHHTVIMKELPLSNFLKYYDLILELPAIFPKTDFVFRPHPLLFTTLVNEGIWTLKQVEEYLMKVSELGIEYSTGGDYFGLFAECDAIVHDCGSYTVEWLFTGKPGCFVYNENLTSEHLTHLMNESLKKYAIARNKEDIIAFIRDVVEERIIPDSQIDQWIQDKIMVNYPHASEKVFEELDILK